MDPCSVADRLYLAPLANLVPHERVSYKFHWDRSRYRRTEGMAPPPVIVTRFPDAAGVLDDDLEGEKLVILDGMHRRKLYEREGFSHAPCLAVDYDTVTLSGWDGILEHQGIDLEGCRVLFEQVLDELRAHPLQDFDGTPIDFDGVVVREGADDLAVLRKGLTAESRSVLYACADQGFATLAVTAHNPPPYHGVSIIVSAIESRFEHKYNKSDARWDAIKAVFADGSEEHLSSSTNVVLLLRPHFTKDEVYETARRVATQGDEWLLPRKSTRHIIDDHVNPHDIHIDLALLQDDGNGDAWSRTRTARENL